MQNNLVIPAAGLSSRYPNMKPKWLLTHPDGSLMIEKVLETFNLDKYDKVIITILKEHCEKFDADVVLKQIFHEKIKVCVLKSRTKDPSETIYRTIEEQNLQGFITIKDSDCYVKGNFPLYSSFVASMKLEDILKSTTKIHNKSFIMASEEGLIHDIVEKKVVSNLICLGVFCIKISKFIEAYQKIKDSLVYKMGEEVYVSHIISYLVYSGESIHSIEAIEFKDWGTIEEWEAEQKKYRSYFFDIDGVFLQNCGKYGIKNWSNYFEPIEDNLKILEKLSNNGAQIFFTTSRSDEYIKRFKDLLDERGIKFEKIITDCHHSQRIIVNDFAPTNPYPSANSVSIPRNSSLKDYIK
jgi:hypothetical protein